MTGVSGTEPLPQSGPVGEEGTEGHESLVTQVGGGDLDGVLPGLSQSL